MPSENAANKVVTLTTAIRVWGTDYEVELSTWTHDCQDVRFIIGPFASVKFRERKNERDTSTPIDAFCILAEGRCKPIAGAVVLCATGTML